MQEASKIIKQMDENTRTLRKIQDLKNRMESDDDMSSEDMPVNFEITPIVFPLRKKNKEAYLKRRKNHQEHLSKAARMLKKQNLKFSQFSHV